MRYSGRVITLRDLGVRVRVKQVNKTTARKLYNEGKTVYLQSCNMSLNNPWQSPYPISKEDERWNGSSFDGMVNGFQWWNCDAKRGRYANFFVEVD